MPPVDTPPVGGGIVNGFFGEIFDFEFEPPPNDDGVPFLRMPVGVGGVEAEGGELAEGVLPGDLGVPVSNNKNNLAHSDTAVPVPVRPCVRPTLRYCARRA